jgi:hypothetical protein
MTAKKAIEFLRMHFEYLKERWKPYPDYNVLEAIRFAISALEKQVSKKPDFTEDKEFALCPCCNGKGLLNKQKYCNNCGQKIDFDWGDAE